MVVSALPAATPGSPRPPLIPPGASRAHSPALPANLAIDQGALHRRRVGASTERRSQTTKEMQQRVGRQAQVRRRDGRGDARDQRDGPARARGDCPPPSPEERLSAARATSAISAANTVHCFTCDPGNSNNTGNRGGDDPDLGRRADPGASNLPCRSQPARAALRRARLAAMSAGTRSAAGPPPLTPLARRRLGRRPDPSVPASSPPPTRADFGQHVGPGSEGGILRPLRWSMPSPALLVKALWDGPGWRGARVRRITTLPIAGAKVPNCGRQSVWSDGTVGRSAARIRHEWAAFAVDRPTKRA